MDKKTTVETVPATENTGKDILLTDRRDTIIRQHVYASAGVGLIPIPFVDVLGSAGVQLNMMKKLSEFYKVDFNEKLAKKIIIALCGGIIPAILTPGIKGIVKCIPIVGLPLVAATVPLLEATSTYGMARVLCSHFEKGGNFVNFNVNIAKDEFAAIISDEELKAKLLNVISLKKKTDEEAEPALA
ncbi:MAG: DUF697 domain-containing protein [Ruminococcus sp.]|jgi:uncharacterized protein (DUF697 family)|nr:DUF697 domain-containing protein [Ruminococcus sp.]